MFTSIPTLFLTRRLQQPLSSHNVVAHKLLVDQSADLRVSDDQVGAARELLFPRAGSGNVLNDDADVRMLLAQYRRIGAVLVDGNNLAEAFCLQLWNQILPDKAGGPSD